jgi:hypothetical protein
LRFVAQTGQPTQAKGSSLARAVSSTVEDSLNHIVSKSDKRAFQVHCALGVAAPRVVFKLLADGYIALGAAKLSERFVAGVAVQQFFRMRLLWQKEQSRN